MIFNARAWERGPAGIPCARSSGESVREPAGAGQRGQSRCHVSSAFSVSLITALVSHPRRVPGLFTKRGRILLSSSQTGSSLEVAVLACMSGIRWICPQINRTRDGFLKGVMLIHCAIKNLSRGRRSAGAIPSLPRFMSHEYFDSFGVIVFAYLSLCLV